MSNDLISRKALSQNLREYLNRSRLGEITSESELRVGEIANIILSVPTAFDKEKVIDKLRTLPELEVKQYPLHGKYIKKNIAIEIVEKGGV